MSLVPMTDFNARRVSPSRIGTYADCGHAFKLKYLDKVTPERTGSAALFGKVVHRARENWVVDRERNLIDLMRAAWLQETQDEPVISAFLQQYAALSGKAIRKEEEIRRARPEIKAVRMTKDWKTSDIARQIERLNREWFPKLAATKYEFKERDPLPGLYDESLVLAWRYSEKYKAWPNAAHTELAFDFEWEGFQLNGFIDDISVLTNADTGEQFVAVIDAKTYRNDPDHAFKDWRQGAMYQLAVRELVARGVITIPDGLPVYFGVDKMRLLTFAWFQFSDTDIRRLLLELQMYHRGVEAEIFLPASKTCKAEWCDFAKSCAYFHGNAATELEMKVA